MKNDLEHSMMTYLSNLSSISLKEVSFLSMMDLQTTLFWMSFINVRVMLDNFLESGLSESFEIISQELVGLLLDL